MKFIAMVTRTLKPGKTYKDYRKAWFHSVGFGVPTTMYTVVNVLNPREIISIGILECEMMSLFEAMSIDVRDRAAHPLDDVIESTIVRNFGLISAIDDFSAKGSLSYIPPQVDGETIDEDQITAILETIAAELKRKSAERDALK